MSDLVQRSYAPTTVPLYLRHWKHFKSFLIETNLPALWPSPPNHIALYVASLANSGRSPSSIRIALAAVAWFHKINNSVDHTKNFTVLRMLKGLQKGSPRVKKEPITRDILHKLLDNLTIRDNHYLSIMIKSAFLLLYHGCFRVGEVSKSKHILHTLKIENISFINHPCTHANFKLVSHKYSKGETTIAIKVGHIPAYCPIRSLLEYLKLRSQTPGPLFLLETGSPLDRATIAKCLSSSLANSGLQSNLFSTHSFRVGRATDLALSGVSESLLRETGRWSSNAFLKYLRFNVFTVPL